MTVVVIDQVMKKTAFYVRLNYKAHEIADPDEDQECIAQRWGSRGS